MLLYENTCKITPGKTPNSWDHRMYIPFVYLNKSKNPNFYWTQLIIQLNRRCRYKESYQQPMNPETSPEMSILIAFALTKLY